MLSLVFGVKTLASCRTHLREVIPILWSLFAYRSVNKNSGSPYKSFWDKKLKRYFTTICFKIIARKHITVLKLFHFTDVYEIIICICVHTLLGIFGDPNTRNYEITRAKPVNYAIMLFQARELIANRTALFTYFSSKNTY